MEEFQAIRLRIPRYRAAAIKVDFTEGSKILGTEAQRAFLRRYITHRTISEQKGSTPRCCSSSTLGRSEEETLKHERCATKKRND